MSALQIKRVDYLDAQDAQALVFLLDAYAQDPMGGGEALNPENAARLCSDMARIAGAASFIAWLESKPIGLINCFEGYSTFKAKPLLNVHDIAVLSGHRGQGVGQPCLQRQKSTPVRGDAASSHSRCSVATLRPCPATNALDSANTNSPLQRDKRNSCKSGCKVTG